MCSPTENYTQQNYGTTTEKLAFECNKSFSGTTTNLRQQNPYNHGFIHGIIFVTIPYHIIYYSLYQEFLILYVPIRTVLLDLTVLTVTILFIVKLFLIVLNIF